MSVTALKKLDLTLFNKDIYIYIYIYIYVCVCQPS